MKNYQVEWRGPVQRSSGLGIASREYVKALRRQGVDVQVGAIKSHSSKGFKKVLIYHHLPHTISFERERKRFDHILLNTVWETTRIPNRWRSNMNKFDAVCVPSIQNRQAMRASGVKVPIFIVPHGVDSNKYKPSNRKLPLREAKGKFVFVSIFGFQHRKNPEALLKAYWEEFSSADNVILVIKTNGYASYENEQWIRNRIQTYKQRLGITKKTAPVVIISRQLNPIQLKEIYTLGHAFVLPTRGEGVGLPFLEALSSGIPVITTGWGGHMDFVTSKNSFLVQYHLKSPMVSMNSRHSISRPFRSLFAEKGQLWAEVDSSSLKRQMRAAYENPNLCRQKGLQGRQDVRKLTWDKAGIALKAAIAKVIQHRKHP